MKTIIALILLSLPVVANWYSLTEYQKEVLRYTEYSYMTNSCNMETIACKIVELNIMRVKRWKKSIY